MPMTVKVGLAKKVGQPDFGSLGASCDIELELDGGLLFNDREGLQQKIQAAYVACRQAVDDELAGRHWGATQTAGRQPIPAANSENPPSNSNHATNGQDRAATAAASKYAEKLVREETAKGYLEAV